MKPGVAGNVRMSGVDFECDTCRWTLPRRGILRIFSDANYDQKLSRRYFFVVFLGRRMWKELKDRYAGRVDFEWRIALMDASGFPKSREQAEWFYRRSGMLMRSPFMLKPGWFEPNLQECLAPNLVAEAARDLGATDDRVRLALA